MSSLPTRHQFRRTSGLPTQARVEVARGLRVGTSDERHHFRHASSVPTRVETSDASASRGSKRARCRDFRRTSSLPTYVISSDVRWDFRHPKSNKTILRAREVLECLSFDLVLILEHSIFLRPTKFAFLFIVRHILNSRSKIYNHFNHLSLQCLHMPLLTITSLGMQLTLSSLFE